jgi:hypothetical protein
VELRSPPAIGIDHLRELDFLPAVRVATARISAERSRELSIVERGLAQAFLDRLAAVARAALDPA